MGSLGPFKLHYGQSMAEVVCTCIHEVGAFTLSDSDGY